MATRAPESPQAPSESQAGELNRFLRGLPAGSYDRLIDWLDVAKLRLMIDGPRRRSHGATAPTPSSEGP
jgi:hypothetical protein